ncbi:hypothetical protein J7L48_01215, partial [bacterium]|nr:hypothetical protein [bacterium]
INTRPDEYLWVAYWDNDNGNLISNPFLDINTYPVKMSYPEKTNKYHFPLDYEVEGDYGRNDINEFFMPKIDPDNPIPVPYVVIESTVPENSQYGKEFFIYTQSEKNTIPRIISEEVVKKIECENGKDIFHSLENVYDYAGKNTVTMLLYDTDTSTINVYSLNETVGKKLAVSDGDGSDTVTVTSPYNLAYLEIPGNSITTLLQNEPISIERMDLSNIARIPAALSSYCGAYKIVPSTALNNETLNIKIRIPEPYVKGMSYTPYFLNDDGSISPKALVVANSESVPIYNPEKGLIDILKLTVPIINNVIVVPELFPPDIDPLPEFTNEQIININGSNCLPGVFVDIFNNGIKAATLSATTTVTFAKPISLAKGKNEITAVSYYYIGEIGMKKSDPSTPVWTIYDPDPPIINVTKNRYWLSNNLGYDSVTFTINSQESFDTFSIEILDESKNTIFFQTKNNTSPDIFKTSLFWQPFEEDSDIVQAMYNSVIFISDLAGNVSSETLPLYFDLTPPPTMYISFTGEYYPDPTETYRNTYTRFMIKAEDDFSGIKNIEYSFDGTNYVNENSFYDTFPEDTNTTLYYKAMDFAGNEIDNIKNIVLDNIAPENTANTNTIYANLNTIFAFSGSDTPSGLRNGYYKIDRSQWYSLNISSSFNFCNYVTVQSTSGETSVQSIYPEDGWHTLTTRLDDNVGNLSDTVSNPVFLDTKSPEIEFLTSKFSLNDSGFYVISPQNTIPITIVDSLKNDTASGIMNLLYQIDDNPEQFIIENTTVEVLDYEDSLSPFVPNGTFALTIIAEDRSQNINTRALTFFVDGEPPIIALDYVQNNTTISSIYYNETKGETYISQIVPIKITASDSFAIKSLEYTINDTNNWTVINNFAFSETASDEVSLNGAIEGKSNFYARAIDKVENISDSVCLSFYTDNTPPEVFFIPGTNMEYIRDVTYADTESAPGVWYAVKGSTFTFIGNDYTINQSSSGYKNTQFVVLSNNPAETQAGWVSYDTWNDTAKDKESLFETWTNSIDYSFDTGVHTVVYRGIDNVNNVSVEKNFTFFVDFLPPVFYLDIAKYHLQKSSSYYYLTPETNINVIVQDDYSGADSSTLEVKLNSNAVSLPLTVTQQDTNILDVYCKDIDGNTGHTTYTLFVDNRPPTITYTIGNPKQEGGENIVITPYTPINFELADTGCGLNTFTLKLNDNAEEIYQYELFTSTAEINYFPMNGVKGSNTLAVTVYDGLGNSNSLTIDFDITDDMPSVYVYADPETFSPDDDNIDETTTFFIETTGNSYIDSLVFTIYDGINSVYRKIYNDTIPSNIVWDGSDNVNTGSYVILPDGAYKY